MVSVISGKCRVYELSLVVWLFRGTAQTWIANINAMRRYVLASWGIIACGLRQLLRVSIILLTSE
jgi:hypothetical protein